MTRRRSMVNPSRRVAGCVPRHVANRHDVCLRFMDTYCEARPIDGIATRAVSRGSRYRMSLNYETYRGATQKRRLTSRIRAIAAMGDILARP